MEPQHGEHRDDEAPRVSQLAVGEREPARRLSGRPEDLPKPFGRNDARQPLQATLRQPVARNVAATATRKPGSANSRKLDGRADAGRQQREISQQPCARPRVLTAEPCSRPVLPWRPVGRADAGRSPRETLRQPSKRPGAPIAEPFSQPAQPWKPVGRADAIRPARETLGQPPRTGRAATRDRDASPTNPREPTDSANAGQQPQASSTPIAAASGFTGTSTSRSHSAVAKLEARDEEAEVGTTLSCAWKGLALTSSALGSSPNFERAVTHGSPPHNGDSKDPSAANALDRERTSGDSLGQGATTPEHSQHITRLVHQQHCFSPYNFPHAGGDNGTVIAGDYASSYRLPITKGKHADLNYISPTIMAELICGELGHVVTRFHLVDCRYPYEFEGGHIRDAVNIYDEKDLRAKFFDQPVNDATNDTSAVSAGRDVVLFYCEYSSVRGPKMLRLMRKLDRQRNLRRYPSLHFPELYLLQGGYRNFFERFQELCVPQSHTPMLDSRYTAELAEFQRSSKQATASRLNVAAPRLSLQGATPLRRPK